jgi:hypothetical protein
VKTGQVNNLKSIATKHKSMSKINVAALQQYSQSYSAKVCDDFFKNNTSASGQQILKLTDIPQVNMFVVSSIFEKWKTDAQGFRSPYFNFESDTVKAAMQTFMNTVSQQITVKREHLEPLLTDATKNAMTLLIEPKGYFNDVFRNQPNFMLTADVVSQLQKYTKFHPTIPQHIASKMAGQDFVYVNQAITWLDEAITKSNEKPEDIKYWVAQLSDKVPLTMIQIVKEPYPDTTIKIESTVNSEQSFFDSVTNSVVIEPEKTVQEEAIQSEPISEETLNDSFRPEQENLAEQLQNQSISSIPDNIPLHQKFMFTAQLFGGNMIAYEKMIVELEQAGSYDSARELVTYNYANQYGWDVSGEAVGQLIDVLKRRFG